VGKKFEKLDVSELPGKTGEEEELELDPADLDTEAGEAEEEDGEESQADAGAHEWASEDDGEGGDDDEGSSGGRGEQQPQGLGPIPEGYDNWESYAQHQASEAQQARSRLEAQAPLAQFAQQVLSQQQQQRQEEPQGFKWKLPHQVDPTLLLHMGLIGSEKFKELTIEQQRAASETYGYVNGNWNKWTYDPGSMVQDVVLPALQPQLQMLYREISDLRAKEFRRQNQDVLSDESGRKEYLAVVDSIMEDPQKVALEILKLRRQVAEKGKGKSERSMDKRDRAATGKSARGKRPGKKKQHSRSGSPVLRVPRSKRSDPQYIADQVLKLERDIGETGGA